MSASCLVADAMPKNDWGSTFSVSRSASTPSGPATGGIAVALSSRDSSVALSGSLPLTVEVRKVSSSEQLVRFPFIPCSYVFQITNVSTLEKHEFQAEGCDLYNISPTPISPGMSTFLTFPLPVGKTFKEPGTYKVEVDKLFRYRRSGLQDNLVFNFFELAIDSGAAVIKAIARSRLRGLPVSVSCAMRWHP